MYRVKGVWWYGLRGSMHFSTCSGRKILEQDSDWPSLGHRNILGQISLARGFVLRSSQSHSSAYMLGKMSLLSYMEKRFYSHKINSHYINISHEMSCKFSHKLPSGQNKAGNTAAYVILKFYNTTRIYKIFVFL